MHTREPRSLGQIFQGAMEILKAESLKITKAAIVFWVVPYILLFVLFFSLISSIAPDFSSSEQVQRIPQNAGTMVLLMFVCMALFLIFLSWGYTTIVSISTRYREGEELRFREHAMEMIKGPAWSTLAIYVCVFIVFFIAMMIFGLSLQVPTPGKMVTYYFFLFALWVVMQTLIYAAIPAIVHQTKGPLFGLDEGIKLTKSYFPITLGRYVVWILIQLVVSFGLALLAAIVAVGVFGSSGKPDEIVNSLTFNNLLIMFLGYLPLLLANLFFLIFEPLFRTEIYFDLRERNGLLPASGYPDDQQQYPNDTFDMNNYRP